METSYKLELIHLGRCPACQAESRKRLFNIRDSSVYECCNCKLRYLDPCLSSDSMQAVYGTNESLMNLHRFHEGYYDYGDLSTESKTLSDYNRALDLLEKHLPANTTGRNIFDVGFGNGLFLALVRKRGWGVYGIDSSAKNVELVRQKYSLELSCSNLDNYENAKVVYDAISFWDVIEHFPNPNKAVDKARQMLKPDGFLLIAVPNDKSLLQMISAMLYRLSGGRFRKGIETIYVLEHVAYYNLKTLTELLRRHRFELCDYFFTSTDLNKYSLPKFDKIIASGILSFGKIIGLENRLVAIFKKCKDTDITSF